MPGLKSVYLSSTKVKLGLKEANLTRSGGSRVAESNTMPLEIKDKAGNFKQQARKEWLGTICDRACKNQPCKCKKSPYLLYCNLIAIYTNTKYLSHYCRIAYAIYRNGGILYSVLTILVKIQLGTNLCSNGWFSQAQSHISFINTSCVKFYKVCQSYPENNMWVHIDTTWRCW